MSGIDPKVLLLLVPLVLVELGLIVWALYDLTRPGRRVRGDSRLMWGLIIVLVSTFGPILYLLVGRLDAGAEPEPRSWPGTGPAAPTAGDGASSGTQVSGGATTEPGIPGWQPAANAAALAAATTSTDSPPASGVPASTPAAPSAITCRALTKRYPNGVLGLDRLDLDVPAGSVFGLLGPNGAGKTTTLRLLVGLAHATSGSAIVAGVALGAPGLTDRIGFLDQDPRYYGWSTGRELLELVGRLHHLHGPALAAGVGVALDRVGLADAADRRIATYSGGMRQRLGIAQALLAQPPVVILDEPVSSLDPEGRRDLLALIAELRGTATVLFSTHVLADVERVCDRVAILDRGRLVTEGPLAGLLDRYALPIYRVDPERGQDAAVDRLVAALRTTGWATDVAVEHGRIRIVVSDPDRAARELLPAIVTAGLAVAAVERARPTLEDVFLQLTGASPAEAVA